MTQSTHKICILGGGFGGLYTALRLMELPWTTPPEITLVDQRDRFIFAPLLYELLTGELQSWEIAPYYKDLLANKPITFRQATVDRIDLDRHQVHLTNNETLSYDRLVLAMGGETPMDLVPGAAEYAIPFRTVTDAVRVADRLRTLENSSQDKIRVAVVGGGYSGVELACKLAERLGDRGLLRLVEMANGILRTSPEFNRKAAETALSQRSVWVDLETGVEAITNDSIKLKYKGESQDIPVDLVLWTVGTRVAPAIRNLPIEKNARNQIPISTTLQVKDHPEVFALGDIADGPDATGQIVPPTAQAAFQQADCAGWNIWASLSDRPLTPFRYQHLGEMLSLGSNNATLAGMGLKLEGMPAHIARRLIYLMRMPTLEHQMKVGFSWLTQPLVQLLQPKV
ncbi:MAG: NAD(P)/FAD-dependent oxidoreductase [Alkalinema sp. RU_4_3]|nr:NAD(P)/FAD-dependent oxidoreductase [Alkalinema sp. RU_4_3]